MQLVELGWWIYLVLLALAGGVHDDALYGVPPLFEKERPAYWTPQPSYAEKGHKELVKAKVDKGNMTFGWYTMAQRAG